MFLIGAAVGIAGPAHAQVLFTVNDPGPSALSPRFVYERGLGGPILVGGGPGMGLFSNMDQLDDFGAVVPDGPEISSLQFIICFSVDRLSAGTPAPGIRALPPFNVFDQAQKRQQAADLFGTTEAFNRLTGRLPSVGGPSMGLFNNILLRNQSPTYFGDKDFSLLPNADPTVALPPGVPIDDVDGHAMRDPGGGLPKSYYSLSSTSPSLTLLGGTSGADIFFDTDITTPGSEDLFADFERLGLVQQDDIDGLTVYDDNGDGRFNGTDQIFFSLTRNSPSLGLLGAGPADILTVRAGIGFPQIFEFATNLGLLPSDNIDGLKFDPLLFDSAERTLESKLPVPATLIPMGLSALAPRDRRR
ncbi:MAG: hypothetical protein IT436_02030 [Phycisphaerales bacterium]|nr:hypothetical protein [Phycisphaerales bacterium]